MFISKRKSINVYNANVYYQCLLQDKLIPNSAWKDYSANTNYAFDTVDGQMPSDEKQQKRNGSRMNTSSSSQQTLPLSHAPMKSHYYNVDASGRHQVSPYENGNGYSSGQYSNRGYSNGKGINQFPN